MEDEEDEISESGGGRGGESDQSTSVLREGTSVSSTEFRHLRGAYDEYLLTGGKETKMDSQRETNIESIP